MPVPPLRACLRRARPTCAVLMAVACATVIAGCGTARAESTIALPDGTAALAATVTHVVDGDTVDLRIGGGTERARLLGIDTPETVKPDAPVECFGPEASARTKELLPDGTPVLVQRDREVRDRYGRLLVYLWRRRDRMFVNGSLLRQGYARTLSIAPNTTRQAELSALVAEARAEQAGLWATCPPDG